MKGASRWRTAGDASTAGVSGANDEEHSERAVDRRETAIRSNDERSEP